LVKAAGFVTRLALRVICGAPEKTVGSKVMVSACWSWMAAFRQ
jgi:hypothetical protein